MAALVAISLGGVHIGAAVVGRHRAQAAADLAALAAASRLADGPEEACRSAVGVGSVMGAVVRGCDVDDLDVVITVTVAIGGVIGSPAHAAARAGPIG